MNSGAVNAKGGERLMRFIRRTVAPLVAGGLAASALVATVDAADVLPFSGILTQATGGPSTTETTVPAERLDLDALIAAGTNFDTDSVFVDLGPEGDFVGIYEYGAEAVADNVAAELELLVAGPDDPDGDGPIVTERTAAEKYLLSRQCNGLLAMAIRKQVTRPLHARILRPDLGALEEPEEPETPEGTARTTAVETDPIGREHVLPLESVVEIGTITVSVLDLDLIRARPPAVLEDFVAGEDGLSGLEPEGARELFETVWRSCLAESAEEGTLPVPQTLEGIPVMTLKRDPAPGQDAATVSDRDVVTWLEESLEIRVETTFENVEDRITVDPQVDLATRDWLEHFADPIEPGLEVASRLVARAVDETELLASEAFAAFAGFEYGDEVSGVREAVAARVRSEEAALDRLLAAEAAGTGAAVPSPAAGGTEDDDSSAERITAASARGVFPPGANRTNTRRRLSEPPNGFFIAPVAFVQMVAWEAEFLNSDAFRAGWRKGLDEASQTAFDLDEEEAAGRLTRQEMADLDVVDWVRSEGEGRARIDYVTPCYSVTVSALDAGTALRLARAAAAAQKAQRDEVFGEPVTPLVTPPPPPPPGDPFSPAVDDLDHDANLAARKARAQRLAEQQAAERAHRAAEDTRRAEFCAPGNLQAHLSGEPVPASVSR